MWFKIVSGGGGGYGAAIERPAESVVDDVVQGFVSREKAQSEYGVVIIENADSSLGHDPQRTAQARADMRNVPRARVVAWEREVARALSLTAKQTLSAEIRHAIAATEELIAAGAAHAEEVFGKEEALRLGRSLRLPFTNERAAKFWDTDSFDRWRKRHGSPRDLNK